MIELKPDIGFKKELTKISRAPLNTCMQCGTCSVVCKLSPEDHPFPRKEMVYAGWGLSSKLLTDPDVWLCHQCGDCTTFCPRGVNPSDVLAGVRQVTYGRYATPRFMGKLLSRPALLPLAILLPMLIIAGIIYMAGTLKIPEGPVNYSLFFPHGWLNGSFTLLTLTSYLIASIGIVRFWRNLNSAWSDTKVESGFFRSFWKVKNSIILHSRFNKCETSSARKIAHFLVFYGFILLLFVTLFAIYAALTGKYPLSFWNPFKILGNLSSLMLFAGLGSMIIQRLRKGSASHNSTYTDWLLLIAMLLLTLSGTVIEAARFLDWSAAYYLYFFHLVCVWFIIIYLPYTKFGHIIYRTVAMTYAYSVNRK